MNSASKQSKRRQLIQRDAVLVCWLCHEPIDRTLTTDDPGGVSIDHVRPRVFGGGHELSNLKLAHRACNQQRGHRPVEEVARAA